MRSRLPGKAQDLIFGRGGAALGVGKEAKGSDLKGA